LGDRSDHGVIGRYAYDEYDIKGIIGEREDVGLSW
jgi:hypothetical protein